MRTHILLHADTSESEVRRAMYAADLDVVDENPPTDDSPPEVVFATRDGALQANYVLDDFIGYDYIALTSDDVDRVEEVANGLRGALATISRKDTLARASDARENADFAAALYAAAIVAGAEADQEVLALFERAFASDDTELRRAAVFASGYSAWRELEAPLRAAAAGDADPSLREQAEAVLEGMELYGRDR